MKNKITSLLGMTLSAMSLSLLQAETSILNFQNLASGASITRLGASRQGAWHGADNLLLVHRGGDGEEFLVTPAAFPGAWRSTVFVPNAPLLGGDLNLRGAVRCVLELRLLADPARQPGGNALILLIGAGHNEPGHALRLNVKDDGGVYRLGDGAESAVGQKLSATAWTRVEVEIDFDTETASVRVGGGQPVTGVPIASHADRSRFGRIEFKSDGSADSYLPLAIRHLSLTRVR